MASDKMIEVIVNGQAIRTQDQTLVPVFLKEQEINHERVVVEWNGLAQTRSESALIKLSDGDRLEVVRIVAGG